MGNEMPKDQAEKVFSVLAEVVRGYADKACKLVKRTFTHENAESLKQNADRFSNDAKTFAKEVCAKENAAKIVGDVKEFAKKTLTKEMGERVQLAAKRACEMLKTSEGRAAVTTQVIAKTVHVKTRIVGMWKSGAKGKCILIASGILVLAILKSCIFSETDERPVVVAPDGDEGTAESYKFVERCQYCFHERISSDRWKQSPPCLKGRGHNYESIGGIGSRMFGCERCGRKYSLEVKPRGFIHCPKGHACQWREL